MDDIDYFLNYVKKEEEKGIQFGHVEQFLDTYANSLQYEAYLGNFLYRNDTLRKKDHLLRCLWSTGYLLMPLILLIVMFIEGDEITIPRIIMLSFFALLLWPPAIRSYTKKEDSI